MESLKNKPVEINIDQVVEENYMPYAMYTILSRAIPELDGLKLVHRKILYTMYKMGTNSKKLKSADIVGQTMKLHPHGDSSIYETLVRMTDQHEGLVAPYIAGKGNFGKAYSKDSPAASRYTESGLSEISKEMFDGIDENAVDMIDNYSSTMKEPVLLPVNFPSVLVNTSSGIAVGMKSAIAPYNLEAICKGTIAILEGKINTDKDLFKIVGMPEFTTGGEIISSKEKGLELLTTGKGSIDIQGVVLTQGNSIIIKELPYEVKVETIIETITEKMKKGSFKEISDVRDETDLKGMSICIDIKRGYDTDKVLKKLYRLTKLRTKVSFENRLLIDGKPVVLGVKDILEKWIEFRFKTLDRIYNYRKESKEIELKKQKSWEIIADKLKEALDIVVENTEDEAVIKLQQFGLDEYQAKYILESKSKEFTKDKAELKIRKIKEAENVIAGYNLVISSEDEKKKIIISEISEIINKYKYKKKTKVVKVDEDEMEYKEEVSNHLVTVYTTKKNYIKKMDRVGLNNYSVGKDDEVKDVITCRNDDYILVFTNKGEVYKIQVNNISSDTGVPKDFIKSLLNIPDESSIIAIKSSDEFKGSITIVYPNGKGISIKLSRFKTNRSKLVSVYPSIIGEHLITNETDFFILTKGNRVCRVKIDEYGQNGTVKFTCSKIGKDLLKCVYPTQKVLEYNPEIDIDKYDKSYFVKLKEDFGIE